MLDRLKLRHKLVHLIYNRANGIESYQDYERNHVRKDNVEKLIDKKKIYKKKKKILFLFTLLGKFFDTTYM